MTRSVGMTKNNSIWGESGDDYIIGRAGADYLFGGSGDDTLEGGVGADSLYGGDGKDLVSYSTSTLSVTVDLGYVELNAFGASGDAFEGIEDLQGSQFDDDLRGDANDNHIWGVEGNDVLHGRGGADTLRGENGDDILLGGGSADAMFGGSGVDRASYWSASTAVMADLFLPALNTGDAEGDSYSSIEDLQGSRHSDELRGDHGANRIWGGAEKDIIHGRGGNDTLFGEAGDDVLLPGGGDDVLYGGSGQDRVAYWSASNSVFVDLLNSTISQGEAIGDTFNSIEDLQGTNYDDELRGTNGANLIWGGQGNDVIVGRGGSDGLFGQEGNDILLGGTGADVIDGGEGRDRAAYWLSGTGLTIDLGNPAANTGDAAGDRFENIEDLQGSNHADNLTGDSGDNRIWGGAGSDTIAGWDGADVLTGNSGADTFSFQENDSGTDIVTDFEAGVDQLDIRQWAAVGFESLTVIQLSGSNGLEVAFGGNAFILQGMNTSSLTAEDFIFS